MANGSPEVVGERSRASRSASSAKERNENYITTRERGRRRVRGVTVKSDVAGKRTLRKSKRSKKRNASPRKSQNGATAERRLYESEACKKSHGGEALRLSPYIQRREKRDGKPQVTRHLRAKHLA